MKRVIDMVKKTTATIAETKKESEKRPSKSRYVKKGGNGGARPGAGAKGYTFTDIERAQVEKMAGLGVPLHQIGSLIREGIDKDTVIKHFRKELDNGKAKINAKIGLTLYQQAMAGNTSAAIWWTKSQMGWRDQSRIDITSNGQTIGSSNDMVLAAIKRFAEANDESEAE